MTEDANEIIELLNKQLLSDEQNKNLKKKLQILFILLQKPDRHHNLLFKILFNSSFSEDLIVSCGNCVQTVF